mmetsp:Transcript_5183/g.32541  ORF Transcript_5183/g.32541 Transcript_5183/m.32541 type:complete len:143 (-) Transcript_5183:2520-2948(-)
MPPHVLQGDYTGTSSVGMADASDLSEVGFFKLCWGHGESRKTFLGRKYEVLIGRESKLEEVDVKLNGSAQLSRKHAVIFYDFEKKGWYVKVLSKNGIMVHNKLRGADAVVELKPITFMDFVGEWLEFYLPEEDSLIPFPPED